MLQPAEAGQRGSGRSFSSGFHSSGGARHVSAPVRNFSSGGARFLGSGTRFHNSSARFSSGATFRSRSFSNSGPRFAANRINRFNSPGVDMRAGFRNRTRTGDGQQFSGNSSSGFRTRDFNNGTSRIVGRRDGNWNRHWDRRCDHYWRGHRCRWINNSWVIFATGLYYPFGYGYYPYGGYSYYDDRYYDDRYATSDYSEQSEYDEGAADSSVSAVQSALSREGYYSGAVDGSFGPETRSALRRYQRARGLNVTGRIDRATTNALGLR